MALILNIDIGCSIHNAGGRTWNHKTNRLQLWILVVGLFVGAVVGLFLVVVSLRILGLFCAGKRNELSIRTSP